MIYCHFFLGGRGGGGRAAGSDKAVSDLERAIAGLARFDGRCPPNIRFLGHFGAPNICSLSY